MPAVQKLLRKCRILFIKVDDKMNVSSNLLIGFITLYARLLKYNNNCGIFILHNTFFHMNGMLGDIVETNEIDDMSLNSLWYVKSHFPEYPFFAPFIHYTMFVVNFVVYSPIRMIKHMQEKYI